MRSCILVWSLAACAASSEPLPPYDEPPPAEAWDPTVEPDTYLCTGETRITDLTRGETRGRVVLGFDDEEPTWLLYRFSDANGNGIPEWVEHYERDDAGMPLRFERERQQDEITTYTYDDDGQLVLTESDDDRDGTIDRREVRTWEEGRITTVGLDNDRDSAIDRLYTYHYDEHGRIAQVEGDWGLDDDVDWRVRYTWDDPALRTGVVLVVEDDGDDGTDDKITRLELDLDGNLLSQTEDTNADGTWERETVQTFDDDGNKLSKTLTGEFQGGTYVQAETFAYDALDRTIEYTHRYDLGDEVLWDELHETTYGGTCP